MISRTSLLAVLLPACLGVLLYAGLFRAPFLYDDVPYVQRNPLVAEGGTVVSIWTSSFPPDRPFAGLYRPVTATSYLADRALFGMSPGGFHLANAVWHGLVSGSLALLLLSLGLTPIVALLAGLLFAAHPVHTEAVAWITGRSEVVAAAFTVWACLAWISWRRTGRMPLAMAAGALYFLALGGKETAAPLPAVLLLGDLLGIWGVPEGAQGRDDGTASSGVQGKARRGAGYLALAAGGFLYFLLRLNALGRFGMGEETRAFSEMAGSARISTALAGFFRSLVLTVVPHNLKVDYEDFVRESLADPVAMLGMVSLLLLSGLFLWGLKRRRPLTFWLGWFLLFLSTTSNLVIEIGAVYGERFLYLPSAAACVLAATFIGGGVRSAQQAKSRLFTGAAAAVIVFFSWQTLDRNQVWSDEETFWRFAAAQSPSSEKVLHHLGSFLVQKGMTMQNEGYHDEAAAVFRQGLSLQHEAGTISSDRAAMLYKLGSIHFRRKEYGEALPLFGEVVSAVEDNPLMLYEGRDWLYVFYGNTLEALGKTDEALQAFDRVAKEFPDHAPGALLNAGNIHLRRGDEGKAAEAYREALERDERFAMAHYALGVLSLKRGDAAEGIDSLERALKLELGEEYRGSLSRTLQKAFQEKVEEGKYDEAEVIVRKEIDLNGESPDRLLSLAFLEERRGNAREAGAVYRRVLEMDPSNERAAGRLRARGGGE